MKRFVGSLVLAAVVAGCASAGDGGGSTRGARDVLTRDEIMTTNAATAYEAIRQLRPAFFRTRGAQSIQNPDPEYAVVYINGVRAGDLSALHSIRASDVQEARYMSASEATTRYGTGHTGGVIEVRTRS